MAITPADFKIRYPEFDSIADARVQTFLDEAILEVGEGAWGTLYEKGVFLLAAHMLAIDQLNQSSGGGGSVVGELTSRKIGDVTVTLASSQSSNDDDKWYTRTTYGAEYLRLKKRMGMGIVAVS